MRTTITLDPDVRALLEQQMRTRGVSFKEAVNEAVRAGLRRPPLPDGGPPLPSYPMGLRAGIDVTKALQLAGRLEDEELMRKLAARK